VADRARAAVSGDAAGRFEGERAALVLRAFSSEPTRMSLRDGRIEQRVFSARTPPEVPAHPAFFDLETTRPAETAWVLSVLAMQPRAADADALAESVEPITAPGWTGIRVSRAGRPESVLFRAADDAGALAFEGWATDAEVLMVSERQEGDRFSAQRGRQIERDGRRLLSAEAPVDAAVQIGGGRIEADVRSDGPAVLRLLVEGRPHRVTLDGREPPAGSWRHSGQVLAISVPAGESRIVVETGEGRRR
jgi:hypothetical protein